MKIKLEMFEDATGFDGTLESGLETLCWQLLINDKEVGELDTYENICKKLNMIFELEEKCLLN